MIFETIDKIPQTLVSSKGKSIIYIFNIFWLLCIILYFQYVIDFIVTNVCDSFVFTKRYHS